MRKVLGFVGLKTTGDKTNVAYAEHFNAVENRKTNAFGRAMIGMLSAWEDYATAHAKRYEAPIGDDPVIGVYWAEAGLAIKRLLDGDTGGLDCGSIDHNILSALEEQGFENDGYNLTNIDPSA